MNTESPFSDVTESTSALRSLVRPSLGEECVLKKCCKKYKKGKRCKSCPER